MKKFLPKTKKEKKFVEYFESTDFGDFIKPTDLKQVNFQLKKQDKLISFRLSTDLLHLLKKAANKNHTRYQKLIRSILEQNIKNYL